MYKYLVFVFFHIIRKRYDTEEVSAEEKKNVKTYKNF